MSGMQQKGMVKMKRILFVINTLGRAGAETSLISLLKKMDAKGCEISLYVLTGQGEMISQIPSYVKVLNAKFSGQTLWSKKGRRELFRTVWKAFLKNGRYLRKIGSVMSNLIDMNRRGRIQKDKLFWRVLAEGAVRFEDRFDLAIAWLEGGAAYYVAEHVKADKKAAFIHIDYEKAGYTRKMDEDCWRYYEKIFIVSGDAREKFRKIYPEYEDRTAVFPNIIDQEQILCRAGEAGGFADSYKGMRILTVGRLTYQKGYDIAIDAMKIVKDRGYCVRWYVLGEGEQRRALEKKIRLLGLEKDFLLLGAVENPYPYFAQADLYVHAVRFEGQGIVVLEAQTLGCAVIVSDYCGSAEQVQNGKYGLTCELTPVAVADRIMELLDDEEQRVELGKRAAAKTAIQGQEEMLFALME